MASKGNFPFRNFLSETPQELWPSSVGDYSPIWREALGHCRCDSVRL